MTPLRAHLGEHQIVRKVAVGATSTVYEGRHVVTGVTVAIKVLHPEWCVHPPMRTRFLNEAQVLHQIRHLHLVEVIAWGTMDDGPPYMVLEWLPASLDRALASAGAVHTGVAVRVAFQLADALSTLHERGVVHRDLKPANVLLTNEDVAKADVKIADLGLAKVQTNDARAPMTVLPVSTGGSALLGTWDYMAPEQWIRSKDAGPKVDVYALGVLLFQMLAGRLPFVAEEQKDLMYMHLFEPPPALLVQHVLGGAGALIAAMLEKKIACRPTMGEVREALSRMGGVRVGADAPRP